MGLLPMTIHLVYALWCLQRRSHPFIRQFCTFGIPVQTEEQHSFVLSLSSESAIFSH